MARRGRHRRRRRHGPPVWAMAWGRRGRRGRRFGGGDRDDMRGGFGARGGIRGGRR